MIGKQFNDYKIIYYRNSKLHLKDSHINLHGLLRVEL